MAISDTGITSVLLTDTFETWRNRSNQIITVLNEQDDDNPVTSLLSANSEGGLSINTLTSNIVTGANVTGSRLLFSGGNVDFQNANVASGGNVHQIHILGGTTVSGANPDSSISNVQINSCEINLNGKTLRANGSSSILLSGATIPDLGTVGSLDLNGGSLQNVNITIASDKQGIISVTHGEHEFTGGTINGLALQNSSIISTTFLNGNVTLNSSSTLVSNSGLIVGSDVGDANVAIGKFAEWDGGATRTASSSTGRLHVRTEYANTGATALDASINANELVLEGNTHSGITILSKQEPSSGVGGISSILFGDDSDTDAGGITYDNLNDHITFSAKESGTKIRMYTENGGAMQIAGANSFSALSGKLHINQATADALPAIFVDANDGDKASVIIDSEQTTANSIDIDVDKLTSGHGLSIHTGLSSATTQAMTGSIAKLTDNNKSSSARTLVNIIQDHTEATGTTGLRVQADGGKGILIDQNANKTAFEIDSECTTETSAKILTDALTTGTGLLVNCTSDHSKNLVSFITDSTGATGTTLYVRNDTTEGATPVMLVANSGSNMITVQANAMVTFTTLKVISGTTNPVNCRLPVLDVDGTILNNS